MPLSELRAPSPLRLEQSIADWHAGIERLLTSLHNPAIWFKAALFCLVLILTTLAIWPVPMRLLFSRPLHVASWGICASLVPVVLLAFQNRGRLGRYGSIVLLAVTIGTLLAFLLNAARLMRWNVIHPPEWDFQLFWVFGRVASQGMNPYDQGNLLQAASSLQPSDSLQRELYFFHAPPTLLLFLPLGWFDVYQAGFVWYVVNCVVMLVDFVLVWKVFLSGLGRSGVLLSLFMIVLLRPTLMTVALGQTNFIVLLFLLLYWRSRTSARGGAWLALGVFVKPILMLLLVVPALRRRWRVLGGTVVAGVLLFLVSALVFGPETVLGYFSRNPIVHDMPSYLYTEEVNQSLLATVLRLTHFDFTTGATYASLVLLVAGLLLVGTTCWLTWRAVEREPDWGLSLALGMALLIFPKTLEHYALLLVVPMAMLWAHRDSLPGRAAGAAAVIALEYGLINAGGSMVFVAMLVAWVVLALVVGMRDERGDDVVPLAGARA